MPGPKYTPEDIRRLNELYKSGADLNIGRAVKLVKVESDEPFQEFYVPCTVSQWGSTKSGDMFMLLHIPSCFTVQMAGMQQALRRKLVAKFGEFEEADDEVSV